jgi:hypothetical protein
VSYYPDLKVIEREMAYSPEEQAPENPVKPVSVFEHGFGAAAR